MEKPSDSLRLWNKIKNPGGSPWFYICNIELFQDHIIILPRSQQAENHAHRAWFFVLRKNQTQFEVLEKNKESRAAARGFIFAIANSFKIT